LPQLLAPHGIKAEVVVFPNITQRMQAVASGDIQIGYGGINAAILLAANGVGLTVLCNGTEGGWNMAAPPVITKWTDLKGKSVAVQVGSTADLALRWKLKKLGLSDAIDVVNMNNNDMPTALQRGDIAAIVPFEPYSAFAVVNGWAREFWRPYDTPMHRISLGVIASPTLIAREPALVRTIVHAHVTATKTLAADNSAAADAIVKTLNMSPAVAKAALNNTFFTSDSGDAFRRDIEALGGMMLEAGLLKKLPDWGSFINTSFIT
jgi:NitT/TauT family transport system substrate-binding protein